MDMWEQAIKDAQDKIKAQVGKSAIDMMIEGWFEPESMEMARRFFHALVDNGGPPEAIFKALNAAANRG